MMAAAEQCEIRERRRAAVGPVPDVMGLAEVTVTAREATAAVTVKQRSPQGGRDRSRLGSNLDDAPVRIVLHEHPTRVARQALGRFRGNSRAIFDDGLA